MVFLNTFISIHFLIFSHLTGKLWEIAFVPVERPLVLGFRLVHFLDITRGPDRPHWSFPTCSGKPHLYTICTCSDWSTVRIAFLACMDRNKFRATCMDLRRRIARMGHTMAPYHVMASGVVYPLSMYPITSSFRGTQNNVLLIMDANSSRWVR